MTGTLNDPPIAHHAIIAGVIVLVGPIHHEDLGQFRMHLLVLSVLLQHIEVDTHIVVVILLLVPNGILHLNVLVAPAWSDLVQILLATVVYHGMLRVATDISGGHIILDLLHRLLSGDAAYLG